ncbi:ATP-binding protein, partial [Streptomyces caniscabiei]|nr:ATP-binding protein [Streptomyces caniscabiei]
PGSGDATSPEGTAPATTRPLRRRVRGATLTVTTPAADRNGSAPRQPLDADAVRSELDEFEAAVRRAEQDAAAAPGAGASGAADETGTTAGPETPEGQKETGSDDVDR